MATGQGGYQTNGMTIATGAEMSPDMLVAADTQNANGASPQTLAVPLGLIGSTIQVNASVTAHAGGGQASATQMDVGLTEVPTVATNADSVKLPAALAGLVCVVANTDAAQSIQVYGYGTDTINGVATGIGVSQAAGNTGIYFCVEGDGSGAAGRWVRVASA